MKFIIKIIGIFFFALTTVTNANENYFNKQKDYLIKENMKNQNFYFKEVLFLIQNILNPIFI